MKNPYEIYAQLIKTPGSVTPICTSEQICLEIIRLSFDDTGIAWEDIQTGNFENLYIYDIPEEKKQFDIATTRKFITDISIKPYSGNSIYILKNFDTATIESQNALLKTLEDCPIYARIILIITNPEDILETIQSRVILLWDTKNTAPLSEEAEKAVVDFFQNKPENLITYLFEWKVSKEEALAILRIALYHDTGENFLKYEKAIENILRVNENPRNILDTIFLIP